MALCIAPITQPGIILVEFRADAKCAVCWVGIHIRAEDRLVQSVVIDLFNPDARGVCFYAEIIRFFLGQVDNVKFRFRIGDRYIINVTKCRINGVRKKMLFNLGKPALRKITHTEVVWFVVAGFDAMQIRKDGKCLRCVHL